jgi:hypothetical protein
MFGEICSFHLSNPHCVNCLDELITLCKLRVVRVHTEQGLYQIKTGPKLELFGGRDIYQLWYAKKGTLANAIGLTAQTKSAD